GQPHQSHGVSALRRATESACWALRAYAWPAVWLSLAGALALAVALPVLAGATHLGLSTVRPADFGIEWTSLAVPPAETQRRAVAASRRPLRPRGWCCRRCSSASLSRSSWRQASSVGWRERGPEPRLDCRRMPWFMT